MKGRMRIAVAMAAIAAMAVLCAEARQGVSVSQMPEAEWDDTEVATNVPLPAVRLDSRVFALRLELDATPSNNVEVAFGRDANGDGVLSCEEAGAVVAWDCGAWRVVDCATGEEHCASGETGRVALDWRVHFNAAFAPDSFAASLNGAAVFGALCETPPLFLFSPKWNMMRVSCRGMDAPNPRIETQLNNTPLTIRIR